MYSEILKEARLETLDADFEAIVRRAGGRKDSPELVAFVQGHLWCAAFALAAMHVQTRGNRNIHAREEEISMIAAQTAQTLRQKLERGALTSQKDPIRGITAYIRTIINGHVRDRHNTKTPAHILTHGPTAADVFQRVVVYKWDLDDVLRELEFNYPREARRIRQVVAPLIREALDRPDPRSKRATEAAMPLSDVESGEDDGPSIQEGRELSRGRYCDPLEDYLALVHLEALHQAIARLPEPRRTYARAYYIDHTVKGGRDLEKTYGVNNGGYQLKKIGEDLTNALQHLTR